MKPVLFFIFLFSCALGFGQVTLADSLQQIDTTDVLLNIKLANKLKESNKDSALLLIESQIYWAKKSNYKIGLYNLQLTKGQIYKYYHNYDSGIVALVFAHSIAVEMGDDKRSVESLLELADICNAANKKRLAISYLNKSFDLSDNMGDKNLTFKILNQTGSVYSYLTVYDTSEIYYQKALLLQKDLKNKANQSGVLMNLGNNAARANNLNKALDYYQKALALKTELKDQEGEAVVLSMMGYSCFVLSNLPLSLSYYQKALNIYESIPLKEGVLETCKALSKVYVSIGDYPVALSFLEKATLLLQEHGSNVKRSELLFNKGEVLLQKGDYKIALRSIKQSLKLTNIVDTSAAHSYYLGVCYEKTNQQDSAIYFLNKGLKESTAANNYYRKTQILIALGRIHVDQGKNKIAIGQLKNAIEASTFSGNIELEMMASKTLYQTYKTINDNENALYYFERYNALQDSVLNVAKARQIAYIEANYDFEKEKHKLEFEQSKERQAQKIFRIKLWIALVVALFFVLAVLWFNRVKQKTNKQLKLLNAELKQKNEIVESQKEKLNKLNESRTLFFGNISHEFRTPLTVIQGMAKQIKNNPEKWLAKGADMISRNSASLLQLVNQILSLSKIETGNLSAHYINGDVVSFCRYIFESFQSYGQDKKVKMQMVTTLEKFKMDYDPDKLQIILSNLISNGLKYNVKGGSLTLKMEVENNQFHLSFKDTGIGISAEKAKRVFDRFYQVDDSSTRKGEGTGIGLNLTKELVNLLGGEIKVESELGKETTFKVSLPITQNAIAETTKTSDLNLILEPKFEDITQPQTLPTKDNLQNLLIIEDNPDVVIYLQSLLEETHNVSFAENGAVGIEKAVTEVPDIIITDVMMPIKDGFEVVEHLKNNQITSHIPIVMLTAKADVESKLMGLTRGADAYLNKPFNNNELKLILNNFIKLRDKLRARYTNLEIIEKPPKALVLEDAFIFNLQEVLDEELDNSEFKIPELCKKLGTSRTQLHKKLKALTGLSTSNYIARYKIEKAKKMLLETDMRISEIAFSLGFNSLSYFARTFQLETGQSANVFRQNNV